MSTMTISNIDRLSEIMNGGSLGKSQDKPSAIKRFTRMATNESHGSLFSEEEAKNILALDSVESAIDAIKVRMEEKFNQSEDEDEMTDTDTDTNIVPVSRKEAREQIRAAKKAEAEAAKAEKDAKNAELKAEREAKKQAALEEKAKAKAEKQAAQQAKADAKAAASGPRGRSSKYSGKIVKAIVTENTRQAGSFGWRSMQILLDNPEGLKYEDYIAKGGRPNDLAWDIDHKRVEVSEAPASEPASGETSSAE